jgi:hypothetical protein
MKGILFMIAFITAMLVACGTPLPTAVPTTAFEFGQETLAAPNGYRPLQKNDHIEGTQIAYQYLVPSIEQPIVDIAFSVNLLDLLTLKPTLTGGLTAFAQDLGKSPRSILGFDENDPYQTEPKPVTIDANKPLEIAFISLTEGTHYWSVAETDSGQVRAAYKFIRRKDGGLRVIYAYDTSTLHSIQFATINGTGTGLVFSARLALLKLLLTDSAYQHGENAVALKPPTIDQYDPRILKVDPSKEGLAQDLDWVLFSRPGPNPGMIAP